MNKADLISKVVEVSELSKKDVTKAVEATLDTISAALVDGESVKLVGFGNFEVRKRSARKGRNPASGEEIDIPESRTPAWKPSKTLKEALK